MCTFVPSSSELLNSRVKMAYEKMISWGLDFPKTIHLEVSTTSRSLGQCCFRNHGTKIIVKVNQGILTSNNLDMIDQTIYHELAHAILPSTEHHGYRWQQVARKITQETGLQITRLTNTTVLGDEYVMKFKHVYRCPKCGKLVGKARRPRWDLGYMICASHRGCGVTYEKIK